MESAKKVFGLSIARVSATKMTNQNYDLKALQLWQDIVTFTQGDRGNTEQELLIINPEIIPATPAWYESLIYTRIYAHMQAFPFHSPLATTRFPLPRAWMRARAALWDLINTWLAFLCGRRSEPLSTSLFLFLYNSPPKIDLCRFLQWSSIHYDRETGYSHDLI